MRAALGNRKIWIWAGVWIFTRFLILIHVGFWNDPTGVQLEDVSIFEDWSEYLVPTTPFPTKKLGSTHPERRC